jgi:aryl-alcohol dehydrogenase-like predicted oxidoreductase
MENRALGRTGLSVSALGFGCGDVGGLIVRGAAKERERAVARAIELGVNYFDTAASYGNGQSETHLGQTLKALGARVYVGTKFRLAPEDLRDAPRAIERSLDASLARLGMDSVDLLQLHNPIRPAQGGPTPRDVLETVVPALQRLRQSGKIRFYGFTANGDTDALHAIVGAGTMHTAQVFLNLLNPSAARRAPNGFPAHDFRQLLLAMKQQGMGAIVVRVAAGGALSGTTARHALAMPNVAPIASGPDYAADVERAAAFDALVRDGHAGSVIEASMRFALASDAVSTILLGYSTLEHLESAAAAVNRGPLSPAALERLDAIWNDLAGRR